MVEDIREMIDKVRVLSEGKQSGLLYHFTNSTSLKKILEENILVGSFMYEHNGLNCMAFQQLEIKISTTINKEITSE
jgi:hypothetical protein